MRLDESYAIAPWRPGGIKLDNTASRQQGVTPRGTTIANRDRFVVPRLATGTADDG
jgi:hypothetical protein